MALKCGLRLFKVIENGADRQTVYDLLLVCHCKCSSILFGPYDAE